MNTRMRLRNQDISRQKRQILEMQRDHMIMKDYITELENRNGRLKKNYFKGVREKLMFYSGRVYFTYVASSHNFHYN